MSASKRKGTAWERRVVDHLIASGFPDAERRALAGVNDKGDVSGIPGVVIECKNAKTVTLSEWIDETEAEKRNAKATIGFCVFPRRNHAIGKAYVLMTLDQVIELIREDR